MSWSGRTIVLRRSLRAMVLYFIYLANRKITNLVGVVVYIAVL